MVGKVNFWQKDWKGKVGAVGPSLGKIAKEVAHILDEVNSEVHHYDVNSNVTSATAGTVICLSNVPVSATVAYGTRAETSDEIKMNSVVYNAYYSAQTPTTTGVRMMLFLDRQQVDNTIPAVADVLETAAVYSPLNRKYIGRFKILRDEHITFSVNGMCGKQLRSFIKLPKNSHARWDESNQISKGHLFFLLIADTTAVSAQQYFRLNYHMN